MDEKEISKLFLLKRDVLVHDMQYLLECQNKIAPVDDETKEMLEWLNNEMSSKQKALKQLYK